MTNSNTNSDSFTRINARYLASKIAADLKRIQRIYNEPSDYWIKQYELEATEYLNAGYAEKVTYGFIRNGKWTEPTLVYTIQDLVNMYSEEDDDPGRIRVGANVDGLSFTSQLHLSSAWFKLSAEEKVRFKNSLPFQRGSGNEIGFDGYLDGDRTYSSGGKSLSRSSLKQY